MKARWDRFWGVCHTNAFSQVLIAAEVEAGIDRATMPLYRWGIWASQLLKRTVSSISDEADRTRLKAWLNADDIGDPAWASAESMRENAEYWAEQARNQGGGVRH